MKQIQQKRWLIAAALFGCFLICFFMDLTGLALHQWMGVASGLIILLHFAFHWKWVQCMSSRFFKKTSGQARLYYLIDAILLAGFFLMIGTGLVISTWLDLTLNTYNAWRTVHVAASIGTLLVVNLKIALHARWIISTGKNIFVVWRKPANSGVPARTPLAAELDRRSFIKLMGLTGAASIYALSVSANSIFALAASSQAEPTSEMEKTAPTGIPATKTNGSAASLSHETATIAPDINTSTPAPTSEMGLNSSASSSDCVIRCKRRCSFPGRCRRYVDSNSNNRCDLGECSS